MQLLKNLYYPPVYYKELARHLKTVYPALNEKLFYKQATTGLNKLELKQRVTRTAEVCKAFLPVEYKTAVQVLYDYSELLNGESFSNIFLSEFIALYGRGDYIFSMQALRDFTKYSSSELAVRFFLMDDFKRTIKIMRHWAYDDNYHVRRLASEGSRPRLPWAIRVPELLVNPEHTAPILNSLKADKEKYVQKSVANHLNDISKDHPDWMLCQVEKWGQKNKNTAWIIKHAARGLIKKGSPQALSLFGVNNKIKVKLTKFELGTEKVKLGDHLPFSFVLNSTGGKPQKLVVDYKVHFVKKSGELKPKVFKIKLFELKPAARIEISKKHLFKHFSSRKHYAGDHELEIIVNGNSMEKKKFQLSEN